MPRQGLTENTLVGAEPTLRPVASLLPLTAKARPAPESSGFFSLANSLATDGAALAGAYANWHSAREQKAYDKGLAEADLFEMDKTLEELDDSIQAKLKEEGGISPAFSYAYRKGFATRRGVRFAETHLNEALIRRQEEAKTTDPKAFVAPEAILREEVARIARAFDADGDVYGKQAFLQAASELGSRFIAETTSERGSRYKNEADNERAYEGQKVLRSLVDTEDFEGDPEALYNVVLDSYKQHAAQAIREGVAKGDVRKFLWAKEIHPLVTALTQQGDYAGARLVLHETETLDLSGNGAVLGSGELKGSFAEMSMWIDQQERSSEDRDLREHKIRLAKEEEEGEAAAYKLYSLFIDTPEKVTSQDLAMLRPNSDRAAVVYDRTIKELLSFSRSNPLEGELQAEATIRDLIRSGNVVGAKDSLAAMPHTWMSPSKRNALKDLINQYEVAQASIISLANLTFENTLPTAQGERPALFPQNDAPAFIDNDEEGSVAWEAFLPEERAAYKDSIKESFDTAVNNNIVKTLDSLGPEALNDPDIRRNIVEDAVKSATEFGKKSIIDARRKVVERLDRQKAELEKTRELSFENMGDHMEDIGSLLWYNFRFDISGQEGRALQFQDPSVILKYKETAKATPVESYKMLRGYKDKEDVKNATIVAIEALYWSRKFSDGLTPDEVKAGLTKEGKAFLPSELAPSVPVFESVEQLLKEWKNGNYEAGGLFDTMGQLMDPYNAFGSREFFKMQLNALMSKMGRAERKALSRSLESHGITTAEET